MSRFSDINRFYKLLRQLEKELGGTRLLAECDGSMDWPERGVYFFMEPGEFRSDSEEPRIVRVGSHALIKASRTKLWTRLKQHQGAIEGKGSIANGSIFRNLVGLAFMFRDFHDLVDEEFIYHGRNWWKLPWGKWDEKTSSGLTVEQALIKRINSTIRQMPFLWLEMDGKRGRSERSYIERNAIALLSNVGKSPVDPPSQNWLGHDHPDKLVKQSGLWNHHYTKKEYNPRFLDRLERHIVKMADNSNRARISRAADINRFYQLLRKLEEGLGGSRRLGRCHGKMNWPKCGVYFFMEPGEFRHNSEKLRVVRVGSHAVSRKSETILWDRLYQHREPIKGNGRYYSASIFRDLVGQALMSRDLHGTGSEDLKYYDKGWWHLNWDKLHKKISMVTQQELMRKINETIWEMPFLWLEVDGIQGHQERSYIERNAIALLSNVGKPPVDLPSRDWLGHYSYHKLVTLSGLWNRSHTEEEYDPGFLDRLEWYIGRMVVC